MGFGPKSSLSPFNHQRRRRCREAFRSLSCSPFANQMAKGHMNSHSPNFLSFSLRLSLFLSFFPFLSLYLSLRFGHHQKDTTKSPSVPTHHATLFISSRNSKPQELAIPCAIVPEKRPPKVHALFEVFSIKSLPLTTMV